MKLAEEAAGWLKGKEVCHSLMREQRFAPLILKVLTCMGAQEELCGVLGCVMEGMAGLAHHPTGVEVLVGCFQLVSSRIKSGKVATSPYAPVVEQVRQVVAGEEWRGLLSERRALRVACAMLELSCSLRGSGECKVAEAGSRERISRSLESLFEEICRRTLECLNGGLLEHADDDVGSLFLRPLLSAMTSGQQDGWQDKYVENLLAVKADANGEDVSEGTYKALHKLLSTAAGKSLVKDLMMVCCKDGSRAAMFKQIFRFCLQQVEEAHTDQIRHPEMASVSPSNQEEEGVSCSAIKVSFFLLCEGQCKAASFKPDKDDSQWWGRRDALCRSVAASMWREEARGWEHTQECVLLFDDMGALRIGKEVTRKIRVPTERRLLSMMRDACLGANETDGLQYYKGVGDDKFETKEKISKVVGEVFRDYPHELPVFGQTNVDNKFRHVIFVLGTVRDMTVNEQKALAAAVEEKSITVLGCNLGRSGPLAYPSGVHLQGSVCSQLPCCQWKVWLDVEELMETSLCCLLGSIGVRSLFVFCIKGFDVCSKSDHCVRIVEIESWRANGKEIEAHRSTRSDELLPGISVSVQKGKMKKAIREIMEHHELSCLVVLDMVEVGCCSTEAGAQDDEMSAVKLADLVYSQPCHCEQSCMSLSARGDEATRNGSNAQQEFDIIVCIKVIKDQSLLSKTSSRINKASVSSIQHWSYHGLLGIAAKRTGESCPQLEAKPARPLLGNSVRALPVLSSAGSLALIQLLLELASPELLSSFSRKLKKAIKASPGLSPSLSAALETANNRRASGMAAANDSAIRSDRVTDSVTVGN
ncbi:hypothetical protein GUITHDRAFT_147565 [Guillardia theta CCMP2712]|uniref:Uncharacterized protein n=1 Tax=Guillardia theta (strain CCMP2712) TaxID=905079 RepID=L1ICI1_GUITC|nr:hypothetical protein GUITHDRAFT_147565 [Guillardia theta CCMP2712]EKX33938.1 hypothetical protein GUITHDRAFT_147565 [Guillardia theta CCMP2712]|eukprot:XP_005820918.1 hypothetical protein GUITHDRAFT_147565 [Guillardia theta CCMP2712]